MSFSGNLNKYAEKQQKSLSEPLNFIGKSCKSIYENMETTSLKTSEALSSLKSLKPQYDFFIEFQKENEILQSQAKKSKDYLEQRLAAVQALSDDKTSPEYIRCKTHCETVEKQSREDEEIAKKSDAKFQKDKIKFRHALIESLTEKLTSIAEERLQFASVLSDYGNQILSYIEDISIQEDPSITQLESILEKLAFEYVN